MVVVSETWMKSTQYANYVDMNFAKAVLTSRPNSHPFQERTLSLEQPVKVGRSVGRARATATNAIFDCKVLSRHHAVLWHEEGKFFLQDTKSSNGTFVNNNRLSTSESEPHEVSSGDIVQFGVDVMENNRKVTHGCIVAILKLYLPDGKEAKASPSVAEGNRLGMVPLDELYKLNQIIQEASQRELCLETKLTALQHVVEAARHATDESWQAYVGEERLLSRVAALETQLSQTDKNLGEDRLREEIKQLHEDRAVYQLAAKEALMRSQTERLEAVAAAAAQERGRAAAENEVLLAKENWERAELQLQELAQKLSEEQKRVDDEREAYEEKLKELRAHLAAAEAKEAQLRELKTEDGEVEPIGERKYNLILNDVKAHNENVNQMDNNNKNEIIVSTVVTKLDHPTNNEDTAMPAVESSEIIVENKDELTTSKEVSICDDVHSDTDTDDQSIISQIEVPYREAPLTESDTKTLKHQYQTVCDQKRIIEEFEVVTASHMARIDLLEKSLQKEKEEKTYLANQAILMHEEHNVLETKYIQALADSKALREKMYEAQEAMVIMTAPSSSVATVDSTCQWDSDTEAEQPLRTALYNKLSALEDELVELKECYARVLGDKQALNRELDVIHGKYDALCNRSHTTLFFYVAPLALMVLYLLISSMFS